MLAVFEELGRMHEVVLEGVDEGNELRRLSLAGFGAQGAGARDPSRRGLEGGVDATGKIGIA